MPTTYDFYMCDAPADDPDEELFEMLHEEVSDDYPELESEALIDKIWERVEQWKRE